MNKKQQLTHAKQLRKALATKNGTAIRLIRDELEGESLIEAAKEYWLADDAIEILRKGARP